MDVEAPLPRDARVPGEAETLWQLIRGPGIPSQMLQADDTYQLQRLVGLWANAWEQQDVDTYLSFYGRGFEPTGSYEGLTREEWQEARRERIERPGSIRVGISEVRTEVKGARGSARFSQSYSSDAFSDWVRKKLDVVKEDGVWKIEREYSEAP